MDIKERLKQGGVGALATDTLYGLVASALDQAAVERVYQLKGRQPDKPFIILIARIEDVERFGVRLDEDLRKELGQLWPGPTSVVLPCGTNFEYLHRGGRTLAFRLPAKPSLRRLIAATGPLVAPSANPEGMPPAQSVTQAHAYFGASVDFYRRGRTSTKPSKLIRLLGGKREVLRG